MLNLSFSLQSNPLYKRNDQNDKSSLYGLMMALLERADIRINGDRPWDMKIKGAGVPEPVFSRASLGLGEAYMDGLWDAEALDEFFYRLLKADLDKQVQPFRMLFHGLRARLLNLQNVKRAWQVGKARYDLSNDFYAAMLDPRMTYTCAY